MGDGEKSQNTSTADLMVDIITIHRAVDQYILGEAVQSFRRIKRADTHNGTFLEAKGRNKCGRKGIDQRVNMTSLTSTRNQYIRGYAIWQIVPRRSCTFSESFAEVGVNCARRGVIVDVRDAISALDVYEIG